MSFRTWLLTGTSIGLLALAPAAAIAQEDTLTVAFLAYTEAEAAGDAAALESARTALAEECIVAGYASVEECIAALQAGTEPAPAAEAAPVTEEPAAVEEPAPAEAAEPAEQAPEAAASAEEPSAEEPAATEEPAAEEPEAPTAESEIEEEPASEQPTAETEVTPSEAEMAPQAEPETTSGAPEAGEQDAPVADPVMEEPEQTQSMEAAPEETASEPTDASSIEAAPTTTEETPATAEEAPATTEEAPASTEEVPAADQPEATITPDAEVEMTAAGDPEVLAGLEAQVEAYNAALADMMAGGDTADAEARLDAAYGELGRLCAEAGYPDVQACLDFYGLELPNVPGVDLTDPAAATPTEAAPEAAAPAEDAPAEDTAEPATTETEATPTEVVEQLPEGVEQEQVAPVLDSAKDAETAPAETTETSAPEAATATEPAPEAAPAEATAAPESDAAAQAQFVTQDAMVPVTEEQGERLAPEEAQLFIASETQVPSTVTIVESTVVNNVTNNTTNNVTNNTTNNIGQQNNVTQNNVTLEDNRQLFGDALTQVVVQFGDQLYVNTLGQDTSRFYNEEEDEIFYDRLNDGRVRETITRPDGTQIVTVTNRNGDVLRRSRITPDGREYVLAYFDDSYYEEVLEWRDPGANLPPLRLTIPVSEYVLDVESANEEQVETFFRQPPVEQVERLYSIDEVKRSARIRDTVRRLEVGGLTFDTGSATISRDQVGALSKVASAMLEVLEQNPAETFLIEGHTDAVGSDISNLRLSDLRAATVARILTDFYDVPPENLATQGYGERYLKIRTEDAQRENRRVTIRRITPLVTMASN
ncbi:OmpA family protein [Devosia sp. RR2S18]|uniref:OmpA family protein n=1 Tax=Devosia rhizosphaerae TaxID=3049774 RepID=UPI0025425843|nr:OmpA family protein [Devosia sp. RR2S18]WIJ26345.1 OmpA family protein [Devosia sp. RR2S18]